MSRRGPFRLSFTRSGACDATVRAFPTIAVTFVSGARKGYRPGTRCRCRLAAAARRNRLFTSTIVDFSHSPAPEALPAHRLHTRSPLSPERHPPSSTNSDRHKKAPPLMKHLLAGVMVLFFAEAALAVAPPVTSAPPAIVPSPPPTRDPKIPIIPHTPPSAPEPASITIAAVGAAAAGAYRLLRRR